MSHSIKQLMEMSKTLEKQLSLQMQILDQTLNDKKKNATKEEVTQIEKAQILKNKVIDFANKGKTNEVNELIKNFK